MTKPNHFLLRVLLFSTPLLVWAIAITLIDPFNYFRLFSIIADQTKIENAASLNSLLFNMLKAKHEPHTNLIIGDSRAENLPLNQIPGQGYFQLAANALKLNESIDLFYFANRNTPLRKAVFTLNFNQFNQFAYADRVRSVEDMINNPLLYLFDRNVAQAAFYVAKAALTKRKSINSTPPLNENEFWDFIVSTRGQEHYGRFKYPHSLYKRISDMVEFAKKQNIEITFIIVPHHIDFQKRVREFGLLDDYMSFKHDMSRLDARVIDFDYINEITINRSNFTDPIHTNQETGRLIIKEVFQGPLKLGKLLDPSWADQSAAFAF